MATFLNNLAGLNAVAAAKGGAITYLNEISVLNAIAILDGGSESFLNSQAALNAIEVLLGGSGGLLDSNEVVALNSIVVLEGGVGGHINTIDAINEWVENSGGFTGILDIVSGVAFAAWSKTHRLTKEYSGPLIRVLENSGDTELDIGYDDNGDLDTVAMEAHCGANDGFVVTTYDQSGNGLDRTNSTLVQQPKIVSVGTTIVDANGLPVARYDGTDDNDTATAFAFTVLTAFMIVNIVNQVDDDDGILIFGPAGGSDFNNEDGMAYAVNAPNKGLLIRSVGADGLFIDEALVAPQHLQQIRLDGVGMASVRIAGSAENTDTYSDTNEINPSKVVVGVRWLSGVIDTTFSCEMDESEMILFGVLSAGDTIIMRNYFRDFYGVTV